MGQGSLALRSYRALQAKLLMTSSVLRSKLRSASLRELSFKLGQRLCRVRIEQSRRNRCGVCGQHRSELFEVKLGFVMHPMTRFAVPAWSAFADVRVPKPENTGNGS